MAGVNVRVRVNVLWTVCTIIAASAMFVPGARAEASELSAAEQVGLKSPGSPTVQNPELAQTVVVSRSGDELFGFTYAEGTSTCRAPAGKGYLAFRPVGGQLRLLGRLGSLATPPVIGGGREAVVGYTRSCKQRSALPFGITVLKLRLLTGPLGRAPVSRVLLSSAAEQDHTELAASPSGNLAVAWLAPHRVPSGPGPELTDLLHISIGSTSGKMGHPVVLTRESSVRSVRLAWTQNDELLIVYVTGDQVVVQPWRPLSGFGRRQVLGDVRLGASGSGDIAVSTGAGGRAVIAWGAQMNGIEPESPWRVSAAVRNRAAARFGAAHLLDAGGSGPIAQGGVSDVSVNIDQNGFASVAWTSERGCLRRGAASAACAAVINPSGGFQPVQELAPESTAVRLGETHGGGTVLQWELRATALGKTEFTLGQARREPAGDSFGTAESATQDVGLIDGADLIDSATGWQSGFSFP